MTNLEQLRITIRKQHITNEETVLSNLIDQAKLPASLLAEASSKGADLVRAVRGDDKPGLMEVFLAEYGLSTDEGVALMCLAEALLRVPDSETIDDLIEEIQQRVEKDERTLVTTSSLVNAATWGLMLTGKVLDESASNAISSTLRGAVKRVGEPVIRVAVKRAMKEMGNQFVLGETIESAVKRGAKRVAQGYTYSYDMLGEAALTGADALSFFQSYQGAIEELAKGAIHGDIRDNPGISIKLSALHPRYETTQRERVMQELVPRTLELALQAKAANMGLNIDAEEADRLDLSLDVIEAVLQDPRLAGWDGFGVVVQAYGKRASAVIEWLYTLAEHYDRKIMVRLVKGAYWDTEIKYAQAYSFKYSIRPGTPAAVFFDVPSNYWPRPIESILSSRRIMRIRWRLLWHLVSHIIVRLVQQTPHSVQPIWRMNFNVCTAWANRFISTSLLAASRVVVFMHQSVNIETY